MSGVPPWEAHLTFFTAREPASAPIFLNDKKDNKNKKTVLLVFLVVKQKKNADALEGRPRLGKIRINFVFRSACTTFAPKRARNGKKRDQKARGDRDRSLTGCTVA